MKKVRKRLLIGGITLISLYLLGFLVLWLGGGYVLNRSGVTRDAELTGFALADVADWQPLFGNCQPKYQWPGAAPDWSGGKVSPRCDAIGWAYYPLWVLVKKKKPAYSLHRGDDLPYDVIDPEKLPEGFRFHPRRSESLKVTFARRGQVDQASVVVD